jgi:hypothetical protein
MTRPQQPEIARSGKTDLDPDHVGTELGAEKKPSSKGPTGPVPPENQPGHRPQQEQDKPDPAAFTAKLQGEDRPTANQGGNGDPARHPENLATDAAALPFQVARWGIEMGGWVIQKSIGLATDGLRTLQRQVRKPTT